MANWELFNPSSVVLRGPRDWRHPEYILLLDSIISPGSSVGFILMVDFNHQISHLNSSSIFICQNFNPSTPPPHPIPTSSLQITPINFTHKTLHPQSADLSKPLEGSGQSFNSTSPNFAQLRFDSDSNPKLWKSKNWFNLSSGSEM